MLVKMSCCLEHPEYNQHKQKTHDHNPVDYEARSDHAGDTMMRGGQKMAQNFLRRFFIVTLLLIPLAIFSRPGISFLGLSDFVLRSFFEFIIATIIFYFSLVFFEHAKHEIASRQYGMMTLVSLGVGAGYLFSVASTFIPALEAEFFLEIATLIWVLLFGHYLEAKSSAAAGNALQEVAKLLPKKAHRITDGQTEDIEINRLREGDRVLIKPGEKVPADGVIIKGQVNLNEAHITGESKPIEKSENDRVIAGSICLDGSLEVKLDEVGENSTIGQIQKLIKRSQLTKPSAQRLADKAAAILTFSAITIALITMLVWSLIAGQSLVLAATLSITVLVVACPHALGLAIPTVSTIAASMAVKNGIFLKDLSKLEVVKDIDYVVFDKTGTLTRGQFGVTDVVSLKTQNLKRKTEFQSSKLDSSQKEILKIAAGLEKQSSHLIGLSIVEFARKNKLKPTTVKSFRNIAGKGVQGTVSNKQYLLGNKTLIEKRGIFTKEATGVYDELSREGKTIAFLADKDRVLGVIALADQIKPESRKAVSQLHKLGIKVAILTGDSREIAQAVANNLGIDTFFAQVLPEKKYEYIKKLQNQGNKVIMVGDGINDAAALTQADVGVAIGAGTDLAVEAGDVVLTRNNPQDTVRLVILSQKVYRKMVENLIWALGYNLVAIPAAAGLFIPLGFRLTPAIGALFMSLSTVIVVINAITLKRSKLDLG